MRFEYEGKALWYATPDAPAPDGAVQAGTEITITVGVSPVDASNQVELLYRVNRGPLQMVAAKWLLNDLSGKSQYFGAHLATFRAGDIVEYIPICHCAGRQVPSREEAQQFASSFRVTEASANVAPGLAEGEPLLRKSEKLIGSSEVASPSTAVPKPPVASPQRTPVTASKKSPPPERKPVEVEQSAFPVKAEAEHRRAKTLEYARLAQLDDDTAGKLAEQDLLPDDINDATLANMVTEGLLNDQQKTDLQLTLELGKLTGDNFSFVNALKSRGFKSVADFTGWEKTDWQQLIAGDKLPLPPGETAESYAKHILFNVERTYPSQSFFSRLFSPKQTTRLSLLNSLDPLLDKNDRLINGENPAALDWTGVEANQRQAGEQALRELTAFANTYRHLGLAELVNNKALDLDQKRRAIAGRLQLIDTFYQNNPTLDLRLVNFFDKSDGNLNWSNIPAADRPLVKKQLMAYQRVLNLADDTADRQMLLNKGYDSAMVITATTESEFVRTSGLAPGQARMIYAKAQGDTLSVAHSFEAMRDVARGQFKDIALNNLDPQLINDLREIDGFDDLFGPQDFCDCEHCRSLLSPAAYFVDLMFFIEQYVSREIFMRPRKEDHPLYLKKRRGDLWTLKLTCENTHTQIPYLTIVNEVLEAYLENNRWVSGDIFQKLSHQGSVDESDDEKISFGLPFNLPLEELRLYLSHFNVTLYDIYRVFRQPESKIWRAKLNLSKEEFGVIAKADLAGVNFRFGNPASLADFPVNDYQNKKRELRGFIKFAGITRPQLNELLNLRFKPDRFNFNLGVGNIEVDKWAVADELQNFPEILKNLTNNRLDFIHRFIRLWRKTAWSIPDLDLVLIALQKAKLIRTDLDGGAVILLAQLVDIQEKLKLTVDELCSLVDELPVSGEFPRPPAKQADRRLYERLFDLKKLFGEKDPKTHELNTSAVYHHYSRNTNNPNDQEIDPKTPLLLGGLGISETELLLLFDLLKAEMPFDADGNTKDARGNSTFDRRRISLLYRHARLAKALKLNIEDFIEALRLNFAPDELVVKTLQQIHQLIEFKKWLKTSPFSVSELRFILKGGETGTVGYKTNLETVGTIVREVQVSQVWNEITPDTAVGIVREVQNPQVTDKVAELKDALARFFHLTSEWLIEILNLAGSDLNSAGIQTALNVHFTSSVNPADLNALRDLLYEIAQVLKIEALKASLAKSFNLASNQLDDVLQWVASDINSTEIETALSATFTEVDTDTGPGVVPQTPADLGALLALIQEIERVLSVFSNLKFKAESVAYLTEKPATLGIADLKNLTLDNLKALTSYKKLITFDDEAEPTAQALLAAGSFSGDDITRLADLWQQDRSLIESLINSLKLPAVPLAALEYLWEVLNLCQTLGVNGYSLQKLANDASFAAITTARDVALGAFSSKYDDEKVRHEKLEPYQDQINVIKRDALCDYIVARQKGLKFKDKNDLYTFFLLDAEMSGCFRISRVVCAISSLQLYAHRILMNLEQSASDNLWYFALDFVPKFTSNSAIPLGAIQRIARSYPHRRSHVSR